MSFDTLMSTTRNALPTNAPHLPMRIEQMSQHEALEHSVGVGDASAYNFFWIHSTNGGPLDIRFQDLLKDEVNTDPNTGILAVYRVIGIPFNYDSAYYKIPAYRYVTSRTDGA